MADLFDSIAKEKTIEKKKTGSTVPVVQTSEEQKKLIDSYAVEKVKLREQENIVGEIEGSVKGEGKKLLESFIMKDKFTKSIVLEGNESRIRVTQSDRFTVTGKETELKETLGPKYETFFEKEKIVQVKSDILSNEDLRKEFLKKFTRDEVERFFQVTDVIKTKKGFDEAQYELSSKEREKLRPYVTQASPGVTVL